MIIIKKKSKNHYVGKAILSNLRTMSKLLINKLAKN